jgi:hypothetical protein
MKEETVAAKTQEVLALTKKMDMDPQERIVVLKAASFILETMVASEALMQTMTNMVTGGKR